MYQNSTRSFRKSNDNKHHLFRYQVRSRRVYRRQRRFNHAYEMGSKYYQQNKTILTNQQIYQLSWNCCKAIQNKLYHRLTIKKKNYVPPVTQLHVQHLFSLQMSLHSVLQPEIVRLNEKYFNMLGVQSEGINPKDISADQIAFQRKSKDYFLDKSKVTKQVKRLVKQHLKISNTVLMYKLNHLKNKNQIREIFQTMEQIYSKFEEHDFPSQHMDYLMIKLSLIEVQGPNEDIPCTYKLPLGFLAKLYQKIRKNKQDGIQHYLNKLSSFLVLTFRNLTVSIEDMYILCSQIQYITKILSDRYEDVSTKNYVIKKKQGLNFKRQVTIDKQSYQDSLHRLSKREESISTYNKLSQKKVQSKRNIINTEKSLRILAQTAIYHIQYSMSCRRQVIQIVLKYFALSYLQKSRGRDSDQIISGEVLLNTHSQTNKKKNNFKENVQKSLSSQKQVRKNYKSLTSILKDIRVQKKSSSLEQGNEDQKIRFHTIMKEQGKFITRNVDLVSKHSELKIGYFNSVNNLLRSIENYQRNIHVEDRNLDKNDILQDFQVERLEKIRSFKDKLKVKSTKLEKNMKQLRPSIFQLPTIKQKQSQKINLLNDVVQNSVIKLLQLPFNEISNKNRSYSSPIFKKLQTLKTQTQNLNTQRNYMVQKLKARKVMCLKQNNTQIGQNQTKLVQKQFKLKKENQEQIHKFSQYFTQKMDRFIQNNKKLMKLDKNTKSPFKIKVLNKPNIKLKLDRPNKKLPQITFQKLQQQYNKLEGKLQKDKIEWELTLSSQFDKLRRDAAKNQFLNQNQRKHKNQNTKASNNTIHQIALEDQKQIFY